MITTARKVKEVQMILIHYLQRLETWVKVKSQLKKEGVSQTLYLFCVLENSNLFHWS